MYQARDGKVLLYSANHFCHCHQPKMSIIPKRASTANGTAPVVISSEAEKSADHSWQISPLPPVDRNDNQADRVTAGRNDNQQSVWMKSQTGGRNDRKNFRSNEMTNRPSDATRQALRCKYCHPIGINPVAYADKQFFFRSDETFSQIRSIIICKGDSKRHFRSDGAVLVLTAHDIGR